MAKQKTPKAPGRVAQIVVVFRQTIKVDKIALPLFLAALILPIIGGEFLAATTGGGVLGWILYSILGLTFGVMLSLIALGRRAATAAYTVNAGKPGAVTLVLQTIFRRSWRGSMEPVAANPRNFAAVYRIVGKPGIVLIAEGSRTEATHLLEAERKKASRVANGVPIHAVFVCGDEKSVPLAKLPKVLNNMKATLNRGAISVVYSRLSALPSALPIPKGIDPRRMRAARR